MRKPGKIVNIFLHYWEEYYQQYPVRETEQLNVLRTLICRTPLLGKHVYQCPGCDYHIEVPHSCKSRFCSVCGYKSTQDWVAVRFNTILNCNYHHVVVTVPKLYRWMIKLDRVTTLNMFSRLAAETIMEWCSQRGYQPGIICFFHTFGSWLQYHPHVHMLVSVGGVSQNGIWRYTNEKLPGNILMNRFRAKFMAGMKELFCNGQLQANTQLSRILYQINQTYKHHWQFYTERITRNGKQTMLYCVRYAKRMIMSESRIIFVDHKQRTVSFFDPKKENVYVYDVFKFMKAVLQHIPEKHFRLIRYYGFYANASKKYEVAARYWQPLQKTREKLTWSLRQWWRTGIHPLVCPLCSKKLILKTANYPKPLWQIKISDIIELYLSSIQMKLKLDYG